MRQFKAASMTHKMPRWSTNSNTVHVLFIIITCAAFFREFVAVVFTPPRVNQPASVHVVVIIIVVVIVIVVIIVVVIVVDVEVVDNRQHCICHDH